VLSELNAAMLAQRPEDEKFLTACYATVRQGRRGVLVRLCSAGHVPARVCRADGTVHQFGAVGQPLGLFRDVELEDSRLTLHPGDILLLHTDGVTEARRGADFFGETRLCQLLAGSRDHSAAEVAERVESAVLEFAGGRLTDDTAVLVLRVPPALA
jgi:sigma-B regulation protein RsbU (phosphoserine phosphatase)